MNTKTASVIIGILFLAVGVLGFFPNPVVGAHNALFHTDVTHNMVHIISGILFLIIAFWAPGRASLIMKIFGIVYLLLGLIGFFVIGSSGRAVLLGLFSINGADNYLHIGLGIVIYLAGMLPQKEVSTQTSSRERI